MTKQEVYERLKLAESLYKAADSIIEVIDDEVWNKFCDPEGDKIDPVSDYTYKTLKSMRVEDEPANTVYLELMDNTDLKAYFTDGEKVDYPRFFVNKEDPSDMEIEVGIKNPNSKAVKSSLSGDRIRLVASSTNDGIGSTIKYHSKYGADYELSKVEVDDQTEDLQISQRQSMFSDARDKSFIPRSEINTLEEKYIDEADIVKYTDDDESVYYSPVIDIADDGRARIVKDGEFELVSVDELEAVSVDDEMKVLLLRIYNIARDIISRNGDKIVPEKDFPWNEEENELYYVCNDLYKVVNKTTEDMAANMYDAFRLNNPIKHYFDENGFMYITGKDTREIYKSVYVKSSNESMALPVKNMEREEVFENGKYTCFYTYTIINPTFKRIIDFARNSLPEGYYDSLDSKIKGI